MRILISFFFFLKRKESNDSVKYEKYWVQTSRNCCLIAKLSHSIKDSFHCYIFEQRKCDKNSAQLENDEKL